MAMMNDPKEPVVLATLPSELEATLVADMLRDEGIDVEIEGEYTSGYRAIAPGDLILMVHQEQLEQARKAITKLHLH